MKAIIFALAAIAAQPQAPVPANEGQPRWMMDWGQQTCSLIRTGSGETPLDFAIQMIPGFGSADLVFAHRPRGVAASRADRRTVVALLPADIRFEIPYGYASGDYLTFRGLRPNFLAAFEAAREIRLIQGDEVQTTFALPSAGRAAQSLRECLSAVQSQWGIDGAKLESLQRWPEPQQPWVGPEDYPGSAMVANLSGQAVLRVSISAEGRITNCVVVATSGNEELDRASCANSARGRFQPALDRNGAPVAVDMAVPMRWQING